MAEYSKIAQGSVVSTGGATNVILPFQPSFIEIWNSTRAGNAGVNYASWMSEMGQGSAYLVTTSTGTPNTDTATYITSGGFSTFSGGLSIQYGATQLLGGSGGITKASAAVITTTANHGLVSGNVVIFQNLYQTASTGMQQIAGIPFVVTVLSATTFSIPWNTNQSNYTAITSGGLNTLAGFKQVLYPSLYVPGTSFISAISLGATTTVTTTAPHNFVVGQEVGFRIPSAWGTTQLNELPDVLIPGSPIYGYVTSVSSSTQVVVNINSAAYTAFTSNVAFANFSGLNFPQIVAVGDNNSGSNQFGYNSPTVYNGFSTGAVSTTNGPAIAGAYINATMQGFIIGASVAGTVSDVIYYKAEYSDSVSYTHLTLPTKRIV